MDNLTEHQIQSRFADWVRVCGIKGAELGHANPNGGKRPKVSRVKKNGQVVTWSPTAVLLKREGAECGIPDYYFTVPRGGFIGLSIEFKSPGGSLTKKGAVSKPGVPSEEQIKRMNAMQQEGWMCVMCWSFDAAKRTTEGYFGLLQLRIE